MWLGVGVNCHSIESVCANLVGTADSETIRRRYLKKQLIAEELPELEKCLNAALAAEIPLRVCRQPRDIPIDFHDRPYYSPTSQEEGLWVRGKARDGTTRFYRVATPYVMLKGLRVTLAIRLFSPSDDTVTVLDTLLHRVEGLEIRVDRLFLDKDFDGIEVMEYLEQRRQPALIACQIRDRTGGTPALCRRNKICRTMHTFRGKNGNAFTAQLAVCRVFTTAGRTGWVKRQADWLVFILIHLHPPPQQERC